MAFYDQLMSATEPQRQALRQIPLLQGAANGQGDLDTYLAFLSQAYHHVKHTVPLLMACGSRLPDRLEWLREAIAQYIAEETGHQEWVLDDIAACGGDAEAVRSSQPALPTELMVSYAWDTVNRKNPLGFFGMVLVLEGTSTALASQVAAALQKTLGLPDAAFSYLTSHGELDTGHVAFFEGLMNRLEQPEDQQAVVWAAQVFYHLYGEIFRGLSEASKAVR